MESLRSKDIFSSDYANKKPFITKKRIRYMLVLFLVICLIGYGATEYITKNTVSIEIRTVKNKRVDNILLLLSPEETISKGYMVINKSPYSIVLTISLVGNGTLNYEVNYNNNTIDRNSYINIMFIITNESLKQSTCRIELSGVKT